jgi:peptidoglycan hydrolase-like protein with peptidoglycan-binding domain
MADRFDLKKPRPRKAGAAKPRRNRMRREANNTLPYWMAAVIVALLIVGAILVREWTAIHGSITAFHSAPTLPATNAVTAAAPLDQGDQMMRDLEQKLAAEKKRHAAELAKAAEDKAQAEAAAKAQENPAVTGIPVAQPTGVPARALPVDPNVLTTERIAAYQVALERMHFSCGFIDGDQGMRTQRMLRAFQQSRGLPQSGVLDAATRAAIGEPGEPFLNYTVTQADIDSLMPKPKTWRDKAKAKRLGYNEIWELLAEKFHCTRGYLKQLNRDIPQPVAEGLSRRALSAGRVTARQAGRDLDRGA